MSGVDEVAYLVDLKDKGEMCRSGMAEAPVHIQEFNTIAGLVFAQLYRSFPLFRDIDRDAIASAMGLAGKDWSRNNLPSDRSFGEVLAHTIAWLTAENYIRATGTHPAERVVLTTKGLATMNAMPSGLKEPIGPEFNKAAESLGQGDVNRLRPQYSRENNNEFRRLYEASGLTKQQIAEGLAVSLATVLAWTKAETSKSSTLCPDWAVDGMRRLLSEVHGNA